MLISFAVTEQLIFVCLGMHTKKAVFFHDMAQVSLVRIIIEYQLCLLKYFAKTKSAVYSR